MFSKILIGVFAVAVMSGGSFAYYHHLNGSCCHDSNGTQATCPSQQAPEVPPCCQQPSRLSVSAEGACCTVPLTDDPLFGPVEVIAIEPREVK